MAIKAKLCTPVTSSWARRLILTCDNELAIEFKNGFCCVYPGTTVLHYEWALVFSAGKTVWHLLGINAIYKQIALPCPAQGCGCCGLDAADTPQIEFGPITSSEYEDVAGHAYTLVWTGTCWCYQGDSEPGGQLLTVRVFCNGTDATDFVAQVTLGSSYIEVNSGGTCSPLSITFLAGTSFFANLTN